MKTNIGLSTRNLRKLQIMFNETKAFSSFSVNDMSKAEEFYNRTLGLEVSDVPGMNVLITLHIKNSNGVT
jgi:catechol-2,3-dioxygenase